MTPGSSGAAEWFIRVPVRAGTSHLWMIDALEFVWISLGVNEWQVTDGCCVPGVILALLITR